MYYVTSLCPALSWVLNKLDQFSFQNMPVIKCGQPCFREETEAPESLNNSPAGSGGNSWFPRYHTDISASPTPSSPSSQTQPQCFLLGE